MRITEMRIGNRMDFKVNSPEEGIIKCSNGAVTDIYKGDVYINEIRIPELEALCPIPLDEEWLKKFGFDDSDYKKGYTGRTFKGGGVFLDFVLHKPLSKGPWNENYTFDLPNHRYVDLPYVHSLQNFFHALTGEELSIHNLKS